MKPTKKQYCTADVRNLFSKFSHAWRKSQGKYGLVGTRCHSLVLVTLVIVASGYLFGCGGGTHATQAAQSSAPPTLPSASTLSPSCTAATTVGAYNCQITVSSGKAPFTWKANSLPRGLALTVSADTTTATISGTVQGQQATTTASYIVPFAAAASVPTTTASVQLTVTDSAGQSASLTYSITLTISPLAITSTSPLPGATLGSPYSAMVTAAGGLQPYTWSLATGSSLPAGLKLTSGSPSATISGTPTATGTFQFTLNVSDAESTAMTASASFTLTVSTSSTLNCPATVNLTLCGTYALGLQGLNSSGGPTVLGATFVADNSGHVVSGGEQVNDSVSGHTSSTLTGGSYVMDPSGDGRGVLTLINSNAVTRIFRYVLESAANPGVAQVEEFDSSGTLASGILVGPETPPIAQILPNTILALALAGMNGSGQRAALLGDFQVGASGCNGASGSFNSLAGEHVVTNTAGTVNTALTIAGTCTASDPNTGLGTAQITISGGTPFTNTTLNFIYVAGGVGAQSAVLGVVFLETDPIAANQPILGGFASPVGTPPPGGFNAASIACRNVSLVEPACLFVGSATTDGKITTGHGVGTIIRIITSPGAGPSGTLTGVEDQNAGGTITTAANLGPFNYTVDSNGVGTISATSTIHFVVHGDTLETLDESKGVQTGSARQQNATMIESLGQPYIFGGGTAITVNVVGVVTPTGATTGTISGTVDISSSAGSLVGATSSGNYVIDSTTGRGTGTANLTGGASGVPIVIYARRHRQFVILDVQSSDPSLIEARLQ